MAHVARAAGVLPLIAAVVVAAALGGAAVFTVSQAACPDPGHFVHDGVSARLVGGCVSKADLPGTAPVAGSPGRGITQARP
ncbi:MAG TPA: hypothetical protein VH352_26435 [Pseudonocardiaceae bacterium]|nr:hypothetical protein [Pseudonocardiaceae bacterium]